MGQDVVHSDETNRQAVLEGVTVLEVGQMYAGPWVGRVLRDYGAKVFKVEVPGRGDTSRRFPPMKGEHSLAFLRMNHGKKSIDIDLRKPEGRQLIRELIQQVDVFVINFKPSTVDAWGLDYDTLRALNPSLVYVSLSGYGRTGPYRNRAGFGSTAEGASGLSHILGMEDGPPTLAHFGLADLVAGTAAALGTMMCLYNRERTGVGDQVDVALYEPMLALVADIVIDYSALGLVRKRTGNSPAVSAPVGTFLSKDQKWLIISGSSEAVVKRLFEAMGRPEFSSDPRYAINAARLENRDALLAEVTTWVSERTRDETLEILRSHDVVSGPVNTAEDIANDPHFQERSFITPTTRDFGPVTIPSYLFHLGSSPAPTYEDPPALGEHTIGVLRDILGRTTQDISDLEVAGVIGAHTADTVDSTTASA